MIYFFNQFTFNSQSDLLLKPKWKKVINNPLWFNVKSVGTLVPSSIWKNKTNKKTTWNNTLHCWIFLTDSWHLSTARICVCVNALCGQEVLSIATHMNIECVVHCILLAIVTMLSSDISQNSNLWSGSSQSICRIRQLESIHGKT